MKSRSRKAPATNSPNEHYEAVGHLLTQLKKHLTESAGEKGTYADYLRLLEFYSHSNLVQPKRLIVGWVDDPDLLKDPSA